MRKKLVSIERYYKKYNNYILAGKISRYVYIIWKSDNMLSGKHVILDYNEECLIYNKASKWKNVPQNDKKKYYFGRSFSCHCDIFEGIY